MGIRVHNRKSNSRTRLDNSHVTKAFQHRYWNVSQDATLTDINTLASFDTEVFDPVFGFGGNGAYVEHTPENNPFNISGGTGGGCVEDGPFREGKFVTNFPTPSCLKRDFIPWIFNTFGQQSVVDAVQSQPDYTSFAFEIEGIPSFDKPSIHGSGHFGVGGVLGQAGNAYNSPGGMYSTFRALLSLKGYS